MSAKEMTIFFPRTFDVEAIVPRIVSDLGLDMQSIPTTKTFNFQASALRGAGKSLLLMEYRKNAADLIHELSEWEKPSRTHITLLLACEASITFYYRNTEDARAALFALGPLLDVVADRCVLDNDLGCLLILASVLSSLQKDANWSWERTEFPDLPDVATSEWEDDGDKGWPIAPVGRFQPKQQLARLGFLTFFVINPRLAHWTSRAGK